MTLAEIGTTFEELLLCTTPFIAIAMAAPCHRQGPVRLLIAGALSGLSMGFKLPLVILPFGLLCGIGWAGVAGKRCTTDIVRGLLLASVGIVGGFVAADGVWAAFLTMRYGNPFFPFLNDVFRSSSALPVAYDDPRFRFRGVVAALEMPVRIALGAAPTAEIPFRDPRDLLGLVASLSMIVAGGRVGIVVRYLAACIVGGYAAWLVLCPIERYAVALDMLAGSLAVVAATRVVPAPSRIAGAAAPLLALALLLATTRRADFFHRPWYPPASTHPPSLVAARDDELLLGAPLSYWAAVSPVPDRVANLDPSVLRPGGRPARRLDTMLSSDADRLRTVALDTTLDPGVRFEMAVHGVSLEAPCRRAASLVWIDTVFCRAVRAPYRADAASVLPVDTKIDFTRSGSGWIYEIGGFAATEDDGVWAVGDRARLAFVAETTGSATLVLRLSAVPGAPTRTIGIVAGNGRKAIRDIGPDGAEQTIRVCIGTARAAGGVVEVDVSTSDTRSPAELRLSAETRPLAFRLRSMRLDAAAGLACDERPGAAPLP